MIQVTFASSKKQVDVKPFPKLMSNKQGDIVYFIKEEVGLPIYDTCYGGDWDLSKDDIFTGWSMEYFTDYNEPITIQNK